MTTLRKVQAATVFLWGEEVGAVAWDEDRGLASFEYAPGFVKKGIEPAPLTMPLADARIYSFPALSRNTFLGLPGLVADVLPDRFGNALIDIWLKQQGRDVGDFSPVERLCYMGKRGMGALEFKPAIGPRAVKAIPLEVEELTCLAADVLRETGILLVNIEPSKAEALKTIIRVGTSAGGARAKAVIAWNRRTGEVRSGQVAAPEGFEPWILKFDGVNGDTLGDPEGFGRIEYAYHKMALSAGMEMNECRLLEENGRAHFMTRRFDRTDNREKIHMQSLCAIGHYDFNAAGEYGYDHAFGVIRRLGLGYPSLREMYRRMVFNAVARNQDDHTRNIAFLMARSGRWRLAPAFDVIWSYRPKSPWVGRHQMRINGKVDNFTAEDLRAVAEANGIREARSITDEVNDAVSRWPGFAEKAGVPTEFISRIAQTHRLNLRAW
ncbi:MAG: type II toxin-antitoxin system HipA family toxin [Acidobacteria bacterium]|nr:type II toxin-antitoxin system HipA family toxin [Acidobacteriota bacterium]